MNAAGVSGPNSRHLGKIRDDGNRTGTVRDRATEIGVSGASQPISNGLLMLIRGNHIVISVLLSEIELESSAADFFRLISKTRSLTVFEQTRTKNAAAAAAAAVTSGPTHTVPYHIYRGIMCCDTAETMSRVACVQ